MEETLFYTFGILLVLMALVVSFLGLRAEGFPSKAIGRVVVLVFAILVVGTAASAVALSREEAEHREHEQAEEEAQELAEAETEGPSQEAVEAQGEEAEQEVDTGEENAPEGKTTLQLAADPSQLLFDTDGLAAKAGEVVIEFENPSAIPHNVVVEGEGGDELGSTPQIAQESATLDIPTIEPGEYTFYCSVPGHREAGMEGSLTVE